MPIADSEIQLRLSGGASNTNPNASLGGAISNTALNVSNPMNSLFDLVTGDESAEGDTEYRVIYMRNGNSTLTGERFKLYITENDGNRISIGAGEAVNATAQTLATEETTPSGVTFGVHTSRATALVLGTMAPSQFRAIYVRRVIPPANAVDNEANVEFTLEVDSPE